MSERTSIFAVPAVGPDVSDFKPKARAVERPSHDEIDRASAGSRFRSREAPLQAEVDEEKTERLPSVDWEAKEADVTSTKRIPMVYRTGRNVVFSAKTTKEMVSRFYALAETKGWKAGETFERAVEALEREVSAAD